MNILVIGSGIAGMSAAIEAASNGHHVQIMSPYVSERSQSVMAAGGVNAVIDPDREADSIESHMQDTYKGGCEIEDLDNIKRLCEGAPENIKFLESLGVVFNRDEKGGVAQRAFGGQSHKRTCYAGSSTGKQIVTALIQKCREYEHTGLIERTIGYYFHSALIHDGRCYGAIMMNAVSGQTKTIYADTLIMATGGQNKIFGKTTGTEICDGYAAGKLFSQGVLLRNLEFIQYHPTTIETSHKRMLITEAARGEGGRLYYEQGGKRVYFMEDQFGEKGNLMPRDVVSKCIYDCPSQVYLDVTFLGKKVIMERLREIYDLCLEYIDLDITKSSIPVYPSVHFFMGGIAVNGDHETNIEGLYAVGECASIYHGANRLGGNSLLAAVHSGRTAANSCARKYGSRSLIEAAYLDATLTSGANRQEQLEQLFKPQVLAAMEEIDTFKIFNSKFPTTYILREIANTMNTDLGITRTQVGLEQGVKDIDYYLEILRKINYDADVSFYENYRLYYMALVAKAILLSASARTESRGSHIRTDYPDRSDAFKKCSYARFCDGDIEISFH